jgi:D-3-phosphoglycerate dehydrogenase
VTPTSLEGLVILLGPSSFAEADAAPRRLLLDAGLRVIDNRHKRKLTREELKALLVPEVVGLIAGIEPLDRDVLLASRLRVISRVGSGLSNVDLPAARELGITVRSTPDGPTQAVAELVLGAMLCLLRRIPAMTEAMHARAWPKTIGDQLSGKTIVVVGFGRIGRRVAKLVAAFGADPVVVDPNVTGPIEDGWPVHTLQEALPRADVITMHCSGEEELLDDRAFARLKPGALVCNCARGGVVNEAALLRAIRAQVVAGAWLDCFVEEPYRGPLCDTPEVLLTPHVGSYTRECRLSMESEAAQNLIDALSASAGAASR